MMCNVFWPPSALRDSFAAPVDVLAGYRFIHSCLICWPPGAVRDSFAAPVDVDVARTAAE